MKKVAIHWFRQDLRLADNPALYKASQANITIPIYIFDSQYPIGLASKLWLQYSLESLNKSLNNKLNIYTGNPIEIFKKLITENQITDIYWNRSYDKYSINRDIKVKTFLKENNISVKSFNGSVLLEPWQCLKDDNSHYKVYTPFYKKLIETRKHKPNLTSPNFTKLTKLKSSLDINSLRLLNPKNSWQNIIKKWNIGEIAARDKLKNFLQEKISNYQLGRDYISTESTSKLSPNLHFGEVSPNQIFNAVRNLNNFDSNKEHFIRELAWRDFCYYQSYFYPNFDSENINKKFDNFTWQDNPKLLKKWQQGQTGIPIIDAGMRQLWQTGYMHNRVRMIVASFLVKNCLINWQQGEKWFFDTLFDADFASNNANWQWVAGCGLDAAPYFRIFNPTLQSEKFQAYEYIRKYIPELKSLPDKYLIQPWLAKQSILEQANITLDIDYPRPIVDLKTSRQRALEIYKNC